jgi:hypothetical protein
MVAGRAVAEIFAGWAGELGPQAIPEAARSVAANALLDIGGLCIAARGTITLDGMPHGVAWRTVKGWTLLGFEQDHG